ncbi:transmembrane protein 87B-like [Dysidea avara]|uniref:transmembrane protein 87B-like n=1 Tax=Dysidea avara TaxID=196820 RepID=UPI003329BFC0
MTEMRKCHALSLVFLIFSVLCLLVSGIPSGGKFHGEFVYIPTNNGQRQSLKAHYMIMEEGGTVCIKAMATPNVEFTISINITQYECVNVGDYYVDKYHLNCSYHYWNTLSTTFRNTDVVLDSNYSAIQYCDFDDFHSVEHPHCTKPFCRIPTRGSYVVIISLSTTAKNFSLSYTLEMKNWFGYLSLVDYPSLIFYGVITAVYISYAIIWVTLMAVSYTDVIQLQWWIMAVIVFAVLENLLFFTEYKIVNSTGTHVETRLVYILAGLISAVAKSLVRVLLVFISLGYGVVFLIAKSQKIKLLVIGLLFGVFTFLDGITRSYSVTGGNTVYFTVIPIIIIDLTVLYWVFVAARKTSAVVAQRHDMSKMRLYKHFKFTIIFAVIVGIIYVTWRTAFAIASIDCIKDPEVLWLGDVWREILFSVVLAILMILCRPKDEHGGFNEIVYHYEDEPEQGANKNFDTIVMRQLPKETADTEKFKETPEENIC